MFKEYNRNSPVYGEFKAPESDMTAGRLVTYDANDPTKVAYADNTIETYKVLGLLSQNVIATNVNTHILQSVHTSIARYGEPVAVYYGDVYWTDQIVDNVVVGDLLYPADPGVGDVDAGKLSKTQHTVGGVDQPPVAIALSSGNAGTLVKIKMYI
ncbi:MAG: hypothetical protein ACTSYR_04140 [Candidatus Odinarchaeia archaeon]